MPYSMSTIWKSRHDKHQWQQYNTVILSPHPHRGEATMHCVRKRILAGMVICLLVTCVYVFRSRPVEIMRDTRGLRSVQESLITQKIDWNEIDMLITKSNEQNENLLDDITGSFGAAPSREANLYPAKPDSMTKSLKEPDTMLKSSNLHQAETDTVFKSSHWHQPEPDTMLKRSSKWIAKKMDNIFDKFITHLNSSLDNIPHKLKCDNCVVFKHTQGPNHFDCRQLKTYPHPSVCLYPSEEDIYLSRSIKKEGLWEKHILEHILLLLGGDYSIGFIDLGANIGVYSLAAAKLGHNVLAIEPFTENVHRLTAASKIDNTQDKIVTLHNAVSDTSGPMALIMNTQNQGDIRLNSNDIYSYSDNVAYGYSYTEVITLNNLITYVNFSKAVMKIDIQGYEHHIFRKANQLMDQVYIPYIFMEWILMREFYGSEITQSKDKDLVQELVEYLVGRGYSPHSAISHRALPVHMWYSWPEDVYWQHELADMLV